MTLYLRFLSISPTKAADLTKDDGAPRELPATEYIVLV